MTADRAGAMTAERAGTGRSLTPLRAAAIVLVVAAATIGGAWVFQAMGYPPCELCLKQRYAYYAGVPLAALVTLVAAGGRHRGAAAAGLALLALVFAASAVFGAYHAGVEWGFWPGPAGCTGAIAPSSESLSAQLATVKVVRCDAAALRILGLSLAGWNAVISLALAAVAAAGARAGRA
jgi:disulfide bond formation protein DsbB